MSMSGWDKVRLAAGSLREHRLRSLLSMLGIAVGIGAVILLTSLGEGARQYIIGEFTQFGTNIIQINPGKVETVGIPGALGGTTRKLTIDDAESLRRIRGVEDVVPVVTGQGRVVGGGRGRNVYVFGVSAGARPLWQLDVRHGEFLPEGDPRRGSAVVVLGPKLARELFGERIPLGEWVRVSGNRLRVIGILRSKGNLLGFDMDDVAYVPVATAMRMFNVDELIEIDVTFAHQNMEARVVRELTATLTARHAGEEDFTLFTQTGMLETFDRILAAITMAVGAIAGISLLVGAIGILTMMWISVGERTYEIGLMRAIGAESGHVLTMFLVEAVVLAVLGGLAGLAGGYGLAELVHLAVPGLPVQTPPEFAIAAVAVSLVTGLVAGVGPARRAARLDPVEALRAE